MAPHSVGPEPEELSRAISELDLTVLRGVDGATDESDIKMGKRYTRDQLLSIRSKSSSSDDERIHINIPEIATGVKTPPAPPRVPPPTPDHLSVTPASGTNTPVARLPVTPEESDKKEEGAVNGGAEGDAKVTEGGEGEPKKKKKKSGGKKKAAGPTGFEEFYADPPLTPDEYEEECDIYHKGRTFAARIETCIQRYRARRKFDSTRANILTKYFALGGIESGAKTFNGGLDQETLDNSTAAEIAAIQATDFVRASNAKYYDPSDTENWVVDWEGVAKGFLSYRAPRILGDGAEEVTMFCGVVKNFLNYVLAHEVCKEYTKEVMAARRLCDVAEREFDAIRCLRQMFPGDFTVAASTLFGENYKRHFEINSAWANPEDDLSQWNTNIPVLSLPVCQFVFGGIVAFIGDKSHFDKAKNGDIHVVTIETRFIEVADVHRASANVVKEFSHVKDPRGLGALKPIGKLLCKSWEGPGFAYEDKTDDGIDELDDSIEEFWIEDEILQQCYPGLKLEVVVHELNIGVKYFDQVVEFFPSFHLYLPNEKMMGWKEPVPNERPPPTEDDPDAEEKVMNAIANDAANEIERI
ncbi:hypothetical protein BCIN_12g03630 [Botrytis cinerea B05.10]|uniref:Argonaute complex, subunit Arb1 n=2 Tax=Botryotinia fuckeliana TaxID=40559 RepID=A0A384JYX4_BOTFB|nr:hypothetical protein BCIN_12g03630 [Botrytis cinerea B05.10]XP_024552206.1 hypothetical protein BCIN_12g03630 [Botrytis cinerea B05.10]ATZ55805.1 hypothetical protein BCIN_12g03630 [Botrytis cinerea B05.10]ATZ55806.1 hypothetical protein BCIN_12g03630 [Botrytis cinerea B05.10]CCD52608.1 hypothetical protein BofuT4_P000550.1 [Botrytis cinerea T4]